ncbi:MAG: hypothetical protein AAB482_04575 [Patescibacteria group bacterium]
MAKPEDFLNRPSRKVISDIKPGLSKRANSHPVHATHLSREQGEQIRVHVDKKIRPALKLSSISKILRPTNIKINKRYASVLAGVLIIGGAIWYVFWSATLVLAIVPKKSDFDISQNLTIQFEAKDFTSTLARRGEGESQNAKEFVNRASGIITIYNNYSEEPQTLVEKTRFQTAQGLIYRSRTRVTVRGKKGIIPGAADVEVQADAPGEKYNIDRAEFTIPGFAGGPKFSKFSAKTKTAIKGGATGEGKVVGRAEAEDLLNKLDTEMKTELQKTFVQSIPVEYMIFPEKFDLRTTMRVTDPPEGSPADKFFGEVRGEAQTLGIEKSVYEAALAKVLFKDLYRDGLYKLSPNSSLVFKNIDFNYTNKTIKLAIEGHAVFEWIVNTDELRRQVLKAQNYDALDNIFKAFPGILRVEKTFRPALLKRVPKKPENLTIEVRS